MIALSLNSCLSLHKQESPRFSFQISTATASSFHNIPATHPPRQQTHSYHNNHHSDYKRTPPMPPPPLSPSSSSITRINQPSRQQSAAPRVNPRSSGPVFMDQRMVDPAPNPDYYSGLDPPRRPSVGVANNGGHAQQPFNYIEHSQMLAAKKGLHSSTAHTFV